MSMSGDVFVGTYDGTLHIGENKAEGLVVVRGDVLVPLHPTDVFVFSRQQIQQGGQRASVTATEIPVTGKERAEKHMTILLSDAPPSDASAEVIDAYMEHRGWVPRFGLSSQEETTDIIGKQGFEAHITLPLYGMLYVVKDPSGELWELPNGIYAESYAKDIAQGKTHMPDGATRFLEFQATQVVQKFDVNEYGNYALTDFIHRHGMDQDFVVLPEFNSHTNKYREWLVQKTPLSPDAFPSEGIVAYLAERFGADVEVQEEGEGRKLHIITHSTTDYQAGITRRYLIGPKKSGGKPIDYHLRQLARAIDIPEHTIILYDTVTEHFSPERGDAQFISKRFEEAKGRAGNKGDWVCFQKQEYDSGWIVKHDRDALRLYLRERFHGATLDEEHTRIVCDADDIGGVVGPGGSHIKAISHAFFGGRRMQVEARLPQKENKSLPVPLTM